MQTKNYGNDTGDASATDRTFPDPQAKLDQAASKAHETVDRVHRKATQVSDQVTTQGEAMYSDARNWIAAHPLQAVASALLAGYVIGRIRS